MAAWLRVASILSPRSDDPALAALRPLVGASTTGACRHLPPAPNSPERSHGSSLAAHIQLAMLPLEAGLWKSLLFLLRRRGLAEERLLLLAWNPLVVIESYGSGHLDLVTAAFLTIALAMSEAKRAASAGVAFAIALLTKYTPLLLVPYLVRKRAVTLLAVAAAVSALLYIPFGDAGASLWKGLATYTAHWEFNGSLYPLLRAAGATVKASRLILAGALVVAALWISLRARSATGAALGLYTAFRSRARRSIPGISCPSWRSSPSPDAGLLALVDWRALVCPAPAHATGVWTSRVNPLGGIRRVRRGRFGVVDEAARRSSGSPRGVDERDEADVEKPEEVEREERERSIELGLCQGDHDPGEVGAESQLQHYPDADRGAVASPGPFVARALDPKLRRAVEGAARSDEALQDGPRVVQREAGLNEHNGRCLSCRSQSWCSSRCAYAK